MIPLQHLTDFFRGLQEFRNILDPEEYYKILLYTLHRFDLIVFRA